MFKKHSIWAKIDLEMFVHHHLKFEKKKHRPHHNCSSSLKIPSHTILHQVSFSEAAPLLYKVPDQQVEYGNRTVVGWTGLRRRIILIEKCTRNPAPPTKALKSKRPRHSWMGNTHLKFAMNGGSTKLQSHIPLSPISPYWWCHVSSIIEIGANSFSPRVTWT